MAKARWCFYKYTQYVILLPGKCTGEGGSEGVVSCRLKKKQFRGEPPEFPYFPIFYLWILPPLVTESYAPTPLPQLFVTYLHQRSLIIHFLANFEGA